MSMKRERRTLRQMVGTGAAVGAAPGSLSNLKLGGVSQGSPPTSVSAAEGSYKAKNAFTADFASRLADAAMAAYRDSRANKPESVPVFFENNSDAQDAIEAVYVETYKDPSYIDKLGGDTAAARDTIARKTLNRMGEIVDRGVDDAETGKARMPPGDNDAPASIVYNAGYTSVAGEQSSSTMWWVLGGLIAAGAIGTGAYFMMRKPKKNPCPCRMSSRAR